MWKVFVRHLKTIMILPFSVMVVIPLLVLLFTPPWNLSYLIGISAPILFGVGFILGLMSVAFFISSLVLFLRISEGTLAPWDPSKKLVVRGYYRHMRNPMIAGVGCVLFSEALVFDSLLLMIWTVLFFGLNHFYFILKEEPDLLGRFGREYQQYKTHVPRWWPRRFAWRPEDD